MIWQKLRVSVSRTQQTSIYPKLKHKATVFIYLVIEFVIVCLHFGASVCVRGCAVRSET